MSFHPSDYDSPPDTIHRAKVRPDIEQTRSISLVPLDTLVHSVGCRSHCKISIDKQTIAASLPALPQDSDAEDPMDEIRKWLDTAITPADVDTGWQHRVQPPKAVIKALTKAVKTMKHATDQVKKGGEAGIPSIRKSDRSYRLTGQPTPSLQILNLSDCSSLAKRSIVRRNMGQLHLSTCPPRCISLWKGEVHSGA